MSTVKVIQKSVFKNLKQKCLTKKSERIPFMEWMTKVVKTEFMHDTEAMNRALLKSDCYV